jgi:hypothetical protein
MAVLKVNVASCLTWFDAISPRDRRRGSAPSVAHLPGPEAAVFGS